MGKATRPFILAKYIIKNKATIRQTAKHFDMAKSTVHLDVSKRLAQLDFSLFRKVKKVLNINWDEKHLRGGFATKKMWENKKAI